MLEFSNRPAHIKSLDDQERYWTYNGLDTCITAEVGAALLPLLDLNQQATYDFERACRAPALQMQILGFRVDEPERRKLHRERKADGKRWQKECDKIVAAERKETRVECLMKQPVMVLALSEAEGRDAKTKARRALKALEKEIERCLGFIYLKGLPPSTQQLQDFIYGDLGVPEHTNHKGIVSMDKEVVKRVRKKYPKTRPLLDLVMKLRDWQKQIEVLDERNLSSDGRFRASFAVGQTETGRWCQTGDAEVLTPIGWVELENWNGKTAIIQSTKNGELSWCEQPKKHEFNYHGQMVRINAKAVKGDFTPEHKMLHTLCSGELYVSRVGERRQLSGVVVAGNMQGKPEMPAHEAALRVMIQADGHFVKPRKPKSQGGALQFRFRKFRKIERCRLLLNENNICYKEFDQPCGYTFYVNQDDVPTWLKNKKRFDADLLLADQHLLVEELQFWDGCRAENTFYTTSKEDAEWAKTFGHLAGFYTSLKEKKHSVANWSKCWRVRFNRHNKKRVYVRDYSTRTFSGKVYCPETVTGFFLIRYKGEIFITGNSSTADVYKQGDNLQNKDRRIRRIFLADVGKRFINVDLSQAESRCIAYLAGDQAYIDAHDTGNVHVVAGRIFWPDPPWTGDDTADKKMMKTTPAPWIAQAPVARGEEPSFNYYDMAKRAQHGLNYGLSEYGLAIWLGCTRVEALRLLQAYFGKYPMLPEYHRYIKHVVETVGVIVSPLGRTRQFFKRPWDKATVREALADVPQGMTVDILDIALLKIWHHMVPAKVTLHQQGHDAILMQTGDDEALLPAIRDEIMEHMVVPVPVTGLDGKTRTMVIPAEMEQGSNWRDLT